MRARAPSARAMCCFRSGRRPLLGYARRQTEVARHVLPLGGEFAGADRLGPTAAMGAAANSLADRVLNRLLAQSRRVFGATRLARALRLLVVGRLRAGILRRVAETSGSLITGAVEISQNTTLAFKAATAFARSGL